MLPKIAMSPINRAAFNPLIALDSVFFPSNISTSKMSTKIPIAITTDERLSNTALIFSACAFAAESASCFDLERFSPFLSEYTRIPSLPSRKLQSFF
jgi:hypothetical protein